MSVNDLWSRMRATVRSRYVLALEGDLTRERERNARLESEVATLRSENRALVNSLLGTAGLPPIEPADSLARTAPLPTVRRRSWTQIATSRELDATRKAAVRDRVGISPAAAREGV